MIVGGAVGAAIGYAAGYAYGCLTYSWALAGKCGCEMQQRALSMSGISEWKETQAVGGAITGAIASVPAGLVLVGIGELIYSFVDIAHTYDIIVNETGITECTVVRILIDVAIAFMSYKAIEFGTSQMKASGSGWKWAKSAAPQIAKSPISRADGMARIMQLRQQYPDGNNLAYAIEDVTTGQLRELVAPSGNNRSNFTVPGIRRFVTSKVGSYDRIWDSEVKILEYIASESQPGKSGTIRLFSEKPICSSCMDVIYQFEKAFPNIKIFYNSGP
jgi:hypothetical protein